LLCSILPAQFLSLSCPAQARRRMTGGDASAAAKSLIKVLFFIRRSSRISGGVLGHSPRGKIGDFPRGASCCDRTTANDYVFLSYLIQHRTSCPRCRLRDNF